MSEPQTVEVESDKPLLHFSLSAEDYRASAGVSKSDLDLFSECPAKLKAFRDGAIVRKETPQMRFGSLLHALTLEGNRNYNIKPDGMSFSTKDGKAWRDDHEDKPIITCAEANELEAINRAITMHPHCAGLLIDGSPEVSAYGWHEKSQFRIKGRFDWLGRNSVVDIKTTQDASNSGFSRAIATYRYHVQAAIYLELCHQNGRDIQDFYFIAIERGEMPLINVRLLSQDAIEFGCAIFNKELRDLRECMDSDRWPDYSGPHQVPQLIDLPTWAYSDTAGMELIGAQEMTA